MIARRTVALVNKQGLHARPISQLVQLAAAAEADVKVTGPDGTVADGASVFSMMTLAAVVGAELILEADGPDAEVVVQQLEDLISSGFGEP